MSSVLNKLEISKQAALLVHQYKRSEIGRAMIESKINEMDGQDQLYFRSELNRYMGMKRWTTPKKGEAA